jgi:hypothetical protein
MGSLRRHFTWRHMVCLATNANHILCEMALRKCSNRISFEAIARCIPSRPGGTTTCCGDSSTCAEPVPRRTSAWPRRSSWSSRSATATAGGRSRTSTPAQWRSRWTRARAGRAGGTCCAPYECWTGIQHETSADAAGRRLATSRTGLFGMAR